MSSQCMHFTSGYHNADTVDNIYGQRIYLKKKNGRGCSSVGSASDRHATETDSTPRCRKGFFSMSQLSVQTLLRCPYNIRVQPHAIQSVHVKDLKHLATRPLFGHTNTPHILLGTGSAALAAAVALPR